MKVYLILIILFFAKVEVTSRDANSAKVDSKDPNLFFRENKGQIIDQNGSLRGDILFYGNTLGMSYHLRKGGISYQLNKVNSWKKVHEFNKSILGLEGEIDAPITLSSYRLDINWKNSNKNAKLKLDQSVQGYSNYYLAHCPNGIFNVKDFTGVTYIDLYKKINLHYYSVNGNLKYDFIVKPGADFTQIELEVNGMIGIDVQKDGSIIFKTPLGEIVEAAPIVYQHGHKLQAKWHVNSNKLSFVIEAYDPKAIMIIDPLTRLWGTYFGGFLDDFSNATTVDELKNVFIVGKTNSSSMIATSGAFQVNFGSGPGGINADVFLTKFDSLGTRLWSTYYGDANQQGGYDCLSDYSGNVYISGFEQANSNTFMSTSGAFQTSGGPLSGISFFSKFNGSGYRIWSSYFNGINVSLALDGSNNLYIAGKTTYLMGNTGIATIGCHQPTGSNGYDGFLAKFDSSGVRLWGTFYGGVGDEDQITCCTDINKNVYITGSTQTNSGTAIATPSSYQSTIAGNKDAFLAKFDSAGLRLWGTYYGDAGNDMAHSCCADVKGNIYLIGSTTSTGTIMASIGSHQIVNGGGTDAFIAKFNTNGVRIWGTFYGDSATQGAAKCMTDKYCNVYFCGETFSNSETVISSPNGYQTYSAGDFEAFFTKFDSSGVRIWGTFYGGSLWEKASGFALDKSGNCYLTGSTLSTNNISSPGCYQDSINSNHWETYLAKFSDCTTASIPINTSPLANLNSCENSNAILTVSSNNYVNWYNSPTSSTSIGTGTVFTTPNLSVGNYSYYVEANSCTTNINRAIVTLTVHSIPTLTIMGNNSICQGLTLNQFVNGSALSYSWSNGSIGNVASLTPTATTTYTVIGTSANSCSASVSKLITVNQLPSIVITSSSLNICIGSSAVLSASGASSYLWNSGYNGTNLIVNPSSTTTYSVIGTNMFGCSSASSITLNVDACTSISNEQGESSILEIFPNPSAGQINIRTNFIPERGIVKIYNSLGQLLYSANINSSIDLYPFPKGIYIFHILSNNILMATKKIVKN